MAFSYSNLASKLFVLCLILHSSCSCIKGMPCSRKPRLLAKLIHRDSIYSPYYNPNGVDGPTHIAHDLESTFARLAYLESKAEGPPIASFSHDDERAEVVPGNTGAEFLVNISFGSEANPQLLIMDTGSNLLWLQCSPCINCLGQQYPTYDPSQSSTYSPLPCDDKCSNYRLCSCDSQSNSCAFHIRYRDGSYSKGQMASEQVTFTTFDEGVVTIPNIRIGCGHDNKFSLRAQASGVLGLGPDSFSLPSQLGNIFSYCLGSITDPRYAYNNLIIGDGANLEGDSTPLELYNSHYYVSLEKITIGARTLDIDGSVFTRSPLGMGGTMIDSGTTFTVLPPAAYDELKTEVRRIIKERGLTLVRHPKLLCYRGSIRSDLDTFPIVTFQFAGGVELQLQPQAMFHQYEGILCMNVVVSKSRNPKAVIGGRAQQFYNFGFDINSKKLYIQGIDCAIFESGMAE